MPLDITLFREWSGGRPDLIRESQRRRFAPVEVVDEIIAKDEKWRGLTGKIDDFRKHKNKIQKEEVAKKKKAGLPCDEELAKIKAIEEEEKAAEQEQKDLKLEIDKMISKIGNIVEDGVPTSNNEDADNMVVRKWGNPRDPAGLLNHHDLLWRIGGYEPERGSNVAGHKGYFLRDVGVLLNQAFINYGIAFLRKRQYCVVQPPFFMRKEVMAGVAQLEEFDEALYKVSGDGDEKYLIATSEQPLCGYHMDEWLEEKALPLRYGGISTCFRKEAGSAGRDVWGIFRVHQFEKVEQFVIVEGDLDKSKAMQEEMITAAEEFYQSLGFPYHIINIVSGALNNAAIKKYDLECWFPGYNAYRELVSCSNCTDYQSRAMGIRCGIKKLGDREKKYVHMLNATLCATGRAICCMLETYQDVDGVHVPEVLVPYMGGLTFLPFVRDSRMAPSVDRPLGSAGTATNGEKEADNPVNIPTSAPAPVVALATVTTPGVAVPSVDSSAGATAPLTPEVQAIVDKITIKGDEIRALKAAKAPKESVLAQVDLLNALKVDYKVATGLDFVAQGGTPTATPTVKPAAALAPTKKEVASKAKPLTVAKAPAPKPEAPVPAPAPSIVVKPAAVPSLTDVVKSDGRTVDLANLDARLRVYSYVAGFTPSKEDNRIYGLMKSDKPTDASFVNLQRWSRQVASYTLAERESWL